MKIQLTILCGPERHFWINPELHIGASQWSHDPRIEVFDEQPSYGFYTSQEARNVACERFMANPEFGPTDCLIMIDNDTNPVNPKSGTLNNLMDLPMMGLPVVGCPVAMIHDETWMLNAMYEDGDSWRAMSIDELSKPEPDKLVVTDGGPAVKVDAVGFGVVCIQKWVLEKFKQQPRFEIADGSPNKIKKWFSGRDPFKPWDDSHIPYVLRWRDDRGATVKGEDFLFCKRAKGLGIQTYVAPQHYCGHHHSYDYGKMHKVKFAVRKDEEPKPKQLTPADYVIDGPCVPITNYAIEPDLADWFRRVIVGTKPMVLELGCGVSTLVLEKIVRPLGGFVHSLEHNPHYARQLMAILNTIDHGAYVWSCPLKHGFYDVQNCDIYMHSNYDLLLIDGPPANISPTGRQQASKLFHLVKPGGLIVLDDAEREGEKNAILQWVRDGLVKVTDRVGRASVMRKL